MELLERARAYVEQRGHLGEGYALLRDCIAEGGPRGLEAVQHVAEASYGDERYALDRKAPGAFALCRWGEAGLDALVGVVRRHPNATNVALAFSVLGAVAAGEGADRLRLLVGDGPVVEGVRAALDGDRNMRRAAYARLASVVLDFETDADAVSAVLRQFLRQADPGDVGVAVELFKALSARHLVVPGPAIERMNALIRLRPEDTETFPRFFETHPRFLDPAAMTVWRDPRFVRAPVPDFVVRRFDGTYVVAALGTPGEGLVSGERLSERAALVVERALKARAWLQRHPGLVAEHLPEFDGAECLVVVGLERPLTASQHRALARAHRSGQGLRVVGFDRLLDRARTIVRNVTGPSRNPGAPPAGLPSPGVAAGAGGRSKAKQR